MPADARSRNIILTNSTSLYMSISCIIVSLSMTFIILAKAVSFALSSSTFPMLSGLFFSCHIFFPEEATETEKRTKVAPVSGELLHGSKSKSLPWSTI